MSDETVHPACLDPEVLLRQCRQRAVRRSGPGGQRRNKVETGIVLLHAATGIQAEAAERRSREENRRVALRRLRRKLAVSVRSVAGGPSAPSQLWRQRCPRGRLNVNPDHADLPALLAEALDTLSLHDMDVKPAAEQLECTPSQLIKLLKLDADALAVVNRRRAERELPRLR